MSFRAFNAIAGKAGMISGSQRVAIGCAAFEVDVAIVISVPAREECCTSLRRSLKSSQVLGLRRSQFFYRQSELVRE
jgi:hypothetical protein